MYMHLCIYSMYYACMHVFRQTCIYLCSTHIYVFICMCNYLCMCVIKYLCNAYTHICPCLYFYIHVLIYIHTYEFFMNVCNVCMYVHTYIYVCINTYIIHLCIPTYMDVYMWIYVCLMCVFMDIQMCM